MSIKTGNVLPLYHIDFNVCFKTVDRFYAKIRMASKSQSGKKASKTPDLDPWPRPSISDIPSVLTGINHNTQNGAETGEQTEVETMEIVVEEWTKFANELEIEDNTDTQEE